MSSYKTKTKIYSSNIQWSHIKIPIPTGRDGLQENHVKIRAKGRREAGRGAKKSLKMWRKNKSKAEQKHQNLKLHFGHLGFVIASPWPHLSFSGVCSVCTLSRAKFILSLQLSSKYSSVSFELELHIQNVMHWPLRASFQGMQHCHALPGLVAFRSLSKRLQDPLSLASSMPVEPAPQGFCCQACKNLRCNLILNRNFSRPCVATELVLVRKPPQRPSHSGFLFAYEFAFL